MNAFSTTLLIVAGLQLLAPAAHAFFWSCPNLASDESVANTTEAIEMLESMFPVHVYLKKGKSMEKIYSCITIETFDSYQTPPPPPPESRFFLDCFFNCPAEEEEPKPYNATITFFVGGESTTANTNISYVEADGYVTVVLSGVPEGMFGENRRQTKLRLASIGDGYFVLIDCSNYFLSFGHERYAYMLVSDDADMQPLMETDWRCMAAGLEEVTETKNIIPGGLCMEPAAAGAVPGAGAVPEVGSLL